MYQSLLVLRFLTTRIMPVIAVAAVALCVTLVIVVVSVMTGFLDMLRNSGRTLVGDVVVSFELVGIPYYEELIAAIEALPEAEAASPLVETFGLLRMPYGPRTSGGGNDTNTLETVQVWGIDPESLARVVDFEKLVYWRTPSEAERAEMQKDDPRLLPEYDRLASAMAMRDPDGRLPGIILGMELSRFNARQRDGSYRTNRTGDTTQDGTYWMPNFDVTLTLVPVTESGTLDAQEKRPFQIVNEFRSGVYQIDANRIFIDLATAQSMLRLDVAERFSTAPGDLDEFGKPRKLGTTPARATTILVKAAPGTTPEALRDRIKTLYSDFARAKAEDPTVEVKMPNFVFIKTWEEQMKDLIGPVENERGLMRILFSLVYVVCAGLVLAIFWSIVHEKTRDIGILRSVGLGRTGILSIFLAYGLTIGVVGSGLGLALGWLVIDHINEIHTAMGQPAPRWAWMVGAGVAAAAALVALIAALRGSFLYGLVWSIGTLILAGIAVLLYFHTGITIWDPSVYYFSRIPNQLDLTSALQTMAFATAFSVFGAAIPAAKAADTDPVRSLRYE
jgi:lipoprotein-releasing system permease protein